MSDTASTEPCPDCGTAMTRVEHPPLLLAWRWFNYGYRPWGQVDMECPACGTGVAMASYSVGGRSLRGRINHIRSRRTLEPVPRFYATVAGVSIGVGWIVSRIAGRPRARWQVPVAAVAAAWVVMESSAFWGQASVDEQHSR